MAESLHNPVTGFNHWFLGSANLDKPLAMPLLPYKFTPPDENGRVPYADVHLASGYLWAMDPKNGHPIHDSRGTEYERLDGIAAVNRLQLLTYLNTFYGSQKFIDALPDNPNRGVVRTGDWRNAISDSIINQSGIVVTWLAEPPTIEATRDPNNPLPEYWNMVGVDYFDDGSDRITREIER